MIRCCCCRWASDHRSSLSRSFLHRNRNPAPPNHFGTRSSRLMRPSWTLCAHVLPFTSRCHQRINRCFLQNICNDQGMPVGMRSTSTRVQASSTRRELGDKKLTNIKRSSSLQAVDGWLGVTWVSGLGYLSRCCFFAVLYPPLEVQGSRSDASLLLISHSAAHVPRSR